MGEDEPDKDTGVGGGNPVRIGHKRHKAAIRCYHRIARVIRPAVDYSSVRAQRVG